MKTVNLSNEFGVIMILDSCVTGISSAYIDFEKLEVPAHRDVIEPISQLKKAAYQEEGIQLTLASGFRGFDRQLTIWNQKAKGKRTLLDSNGKEINASELSRTSLLFAILRWSALPGTSRHHWGTDFDIYDGGAISEGYTLRLCEEEYTQNGPFGKLNLWLTDNLSKFGFFRPYTIDCGAVAPEPWHISHKKTAKNISSNLTLDGLIALIKQSDIELKEEILSHINEIYEKYIIK